MSFLGTGPRFLTTQCWIHCIHSSFKYLLSGFLEGRKVGWKGMLGSEGLDVFRGAGKPVNTFEKGSSLIKAMLDNALQGTLDWAAIWGCLGICTKPPSPWPFFIQSSRFSRAGAIMHPQCPRLYARSHRPQASRMNLCSPHIPEEGAKVKSGWVTTQGHQTGRVKNFCLTQSSPCILSLLAPKPRHWIQVT